MLKFSFHSFVSLRLLYDGPINSHEFSFNMRDKSMQSSKHQNFPFWWLELSETNLQAVAISRYSSFAKIIKTQLFEHSCCLSRTFDILFGTSNECTDDDRKYWFKTEHEQVTLFQFSIVCKKKTIMNCIDKVNGRN